MSGSSSSRARFERPISTLADVPDEELDRLAGLGVTGLWLIGLWQRSRASADIKRRRGDQEAVASAYAIDDYRIADDLGGEPAFEDLKARAWSRRIRIAADMVPNHMGIDSRWVIEHPERFISVPDPPYPAYSFTGPNLSQDDRVDIQIEDHYWDGTDAAVVFRRRDTQSNEERFIYHGNDGTSYPWNDTAQLDYLRADVREAVIQTVLDVARRAPILRFDAAMVLARRHIRRLWFPEPGAGGAIPSRAEHALSNAEFNKRMPKEFWREVVDRVAADAPGTLLLAEAFWLLEGYFVRTLGMHRVYNSAFMHMLRDEDNAGYRKVMRDTLEFDPAILGALRQLPHEPRRAAGGGAVRDDGQGVLGGDAPRDPARACRCSGTARSRASASATGWSSRRPAGTSRSTSRTPTTSPGQSCRCSGAARPSPGTTDFHLYDAHTDGGTVDENVYAFSNGAAAIGASCSSTTVSATRRSESTGPSAAAAPGGSGGGDHERPSRRRPGARWRRRRDRAVRRPALRLRDPAHRGRASARGSPRDPWRLRGPRPLARPRPAGGTGDRRAAQGRWEASRRRAFRRAATTRW